MDELTQLGAGHAAAVLEFEVANRAYFTASIGDRGDDYFRRFAERFEALLAEQDAGVCAFYVLLAGDGSVLGRFNLIDIEDGEAVLGYRVAERAAGRGVATSCVEELCRVAPARHGVRTVRAAAALRNAASRRVLAKAGFAAAGPADPGDVGGVEGTWFRRDLVRGS
jgi:ribosomal-protein-alanine N-acetyltransferase